MILKIINATLFALTIVACSNNSWYSNMEPDEEKPNFNDEKSFKYIRCNEQKEDDELTIFKDSPPGGRSWFFLSSDVINRTNNIRQEKLAGYKLTSGWYTLEFASWLFNFEYEKSGEYYVFPEFGNRLNYRQPSFDVPNFFKTYNVSTTEFIYGDDLSISNDNKIEVNVESLFQFVKIFIHILTREGINKDIDPSIINSILEDPFTLHEMTKNCMSLNNKGSRIWEKYAHTVMIIAMLYKFTTDKNLGEMLMATGKMPIVELKPLSDGSWSAALYDHNLFFCISVVRYLLNEQQKIVNYHHTLRSTERASIAKTYKNSIETALKDLIEGIYNECCPGDDECDFMDGGILRQICYAIENRERCGIAATSDFKLSRYDDDDHNNNTTNSTTEGINTNTISGINNNNKQPYKGICCCCD